MEQEDEMSATDELRRLLDERGVEYRKYDRDTNDMVTWFDLDDGREVSFDEYDGGTTLFKVWWMTPEQAIAATLGNDEIDELKDDYCTLVRENKQLQAKVIAQSDHINKLRGEYKVLDKQMERRCAEYRATIRKLNAELDAATLGNDGVERSNNGVAERERDQLKAENDKLRELVRISDTYCANGYCDPGDGCPLLVDGKCQFADRARKLGVVE